MKHCDHGVPKCGCITASRLAHYDFAIGALRLGSRGIATGAFRQRGIPTILRAIMSKVFQRVASVSSDCLTIHFISCLSNLGSMYYVCNFSNMII